MRFSIPFVLVPEIIAASILAIQIIYLIVFIYAFMRKREAGISVQHPVSVIVCAHDEEVNLKELIPQLLSQNYPEFEVIIVEDRSNDETYDYLLQATQEHARLKMVRVQWTPEHVNGKKFGLTLGIKAAKYEWVLLTDADCRPNSDLWISEMSREFAEGKQIVLGFSSYQKLPGFLNAFIRFETFLTAFQYMALAILGKPYMGVGRNLAYRKSLFLENKGFNNHLGVIGGDDDLFVNEHANAHNVGVSLGKEALTMSKPKTKWGDFYYQKLRHLSVGKHYRLFDRIVLGMFSITWILTSIAVLPFSFFTPDWMYWLLGGFAFRWILLVILFHHASRKLGDPFEAWKAPFLDFIYAFYYLVAGPAALVSKKVRWKN